MTFVRTFVSIAALSGAVIAAATWATAADQHDTTTQLAQAQPGTPGMRAGAMTPGYVDQMKAMQQMHDKMVAARTPEARNALMAEHTKLMHSGMKMISDMDDMGAGAATGNPADMAARQDMMEQRMDMVQSMMQMTIDRMPTFLAMK